MKTKRSLLVERHAALGHEELGARGETSRRPEEVVGLVAAARAEVARGKQLEALVTRHWNTG